MDKNEVILVKLAHTQPFFLPEQ